MNQHTGWSFILNAHRSANDKLPAVRLALPGGVVHRRTVAPIALIGLIRRLWRAVFSHITLICAKLTFLTRSLCGLRRDAQEYAVSYRMDRPRWHNSVIAGLQIARSTQAGAFCDRLTRTLAVWGSGVRVPSAPLIYQHKSLDPIDGNRGFRIGVILVSPGRPLPLMSRRRPISQGDAVAWRSAARWRGRTRQLR
jgi:hypothetical protein